MLWNKKYDKLLSVCHKVYVSPVKRDYVSEIKCLVKLKKPLLNGVCQIYVNIMTDMMVCAGGGNHLIINKKQTTLRFYTIYKTVDPVFHFANYIVIVTSHLKGEDIKI